MIRPLLLAVVLPCVLQVAANNANDPIPAVQALIIRLLGPSYVSPFSLQVISADPATGNDVFELDAGSNGARVTIRGNTGVSLASGLNWYLKYSLNASIGWGRNGSGNQLSNVPNPAALPAPAAARVVSPVKFRYLYNVCTYGYTTAFWGWSEWQNEIDRMALWGINLPLAFVGQELVTTLFYRSLGLTDDDLVGWYSGPAFLPWFRMNNMQGWGGPLAFDWQQQQAALQLQILAAMRVYGMTAALPGFSGRVPHTITKVIPGINLTQNAAWGGFPDGSNYTRDWFLQPTDPHFVELGSKYYKFLIGLFGTDHYYQMDSYNEMNPSSNDPTFLRDSNAAVYQAMSSADPQGVYIMQGWLFVSSSDFWTQQATEAYLSGVPDDKMIILDLWTDMVPTWNRYNSYFGKPWIWNMLLIFGGRRGFYANASRLATGPIEDLATAGSTMVGIGATPEATEMMPPIFDLLFEMGWRSKSFDLGSWFQQFAVRRYGRYSPSIAAATALMQQYAYSMDYGYGTTTSLCWLENSPQVWIDPSDRVGNATAILGAFRLYLEAAKNGEVDPTLSTFRYDLVDLGRQVACNLFADVLNVHGREYQRFQYGGVNSSASVLPTSAALLGLIADLDNLLFTHDAFLVGHWIEDAKAWAETPADRALLELNARNQITLWGPDGEINDYAAKNGYQGLVGDYYGGRWAVHQQYIVQSVLSGQQVNWNTYSSDLMRFQWGWNTNTSLYPTSPSGNSLSTAEAFAAKYNGNAAHYQVVANTDIEGQYVDMAGAWHIDTGVLSWLCDLDPACIGFNTNGWLKNATGPRITAPCDLWLKIGQ